MAIGNRVHLLWVVILIAASDGFSKEPPSPKDVGGAVQTLLDSSVSRLEAQEAIRIVADAGPTAAPHVPRLLDGMVGQSLEVQANVIRAISLAGVPPREATARLARVLQGTESLNYGWQGLRRDTIDLLGRIGPDAGAAVPTLQAILKQPTNSMNDVDQAASVEALGRIGIPAQGALPQLEEPHSNRTIWQYQPAAVAKIRLAVELNLQPGSTFPAAAVTALIERLESDDELTVAVAADLLAHGIVRMSKLNRERAVSAILNLLVKPVTGSALRGAIGTALFAQGDVQVGPLINLLAHDSPQLRAEAAKRLGLLGIRAHRSIDALIRGIEDPSLDVQIACIEALGKIDPAREIALKSLIVAVENPQLRNHALSALTKAGQPAAETLAMNLNAGYLPAHFAPVSRSISRTLVGIGPAAIEPLRMALSSEDARTRQLALETLEKLAKHAHPIAVEIERALDDDEITVRRAAAITLARIGAADDSAIEILAETIESFGEGEGQALTDHEQALKSIESLGHIGPQARSKLPLLRTTLNHKFAPFRTAARAAIDKVE